MELIATLLAPVGALLVGASVFLFARHMDTRRSMVGAGGDPGVPIEREHGVRPIESPRVAPKV